MKPELDKHRPVTRADAEAAVHQIKRAIASGAGQVTVKILGTEFVLEKAADGGFSVRSPVEAIPARFYLPMADRPAGYADEVPFVPNQPVIISQPKSDTLTVAWLAPRDPAKVFAQLDHECVSAGWILKHQTDLKNTPAIQRSYENDGVLRILLCSEAVVSLMQRKG